MSTCASWVISPLARGRARSQVQADERADSAAADAAAVAKAKALVEKKLEEQIVLAAGRGLEPQRRGSLHGHPRAIRVVIQLVVLDLLSGGKSACKEAQVVVF